MDFLYLLTFFVAFVSSLLSGIAGGGGSFIMAPYWLIAGLTPAQGAATGAFMALGMGASSLAAFRGTGHMPRQKKLVIVLLTMAFVSWAVGPFFLEYIPAERFKPILATITLLSLPLLFIRLHNRFSTPSYRAIGLVLLGSLLLASSFVTSSAFSILIAIVLSQAFRFSALQGIALRRLIGLIQSAVILGILAVLGNFIWPYALAGIAGGALGSYIGTRFAIQRGEKFAIYTLAAGAIISSILLLI